jgi:hypothetical protein
MTTPTSSPTCARTDSPGPSPQVSVCGPEECRPFAGSQRARISSPAITVIHQNTTPSQPSSVVAVTR